MAVERAMKASLGVGDEHARAQEALSGGLQLLAQAAVKMFRSDNGDGWQEAGGPGMLVYCSNSSGSQWMKVVQLSDGATLLNEELYEDFNRTYSSDSRAAQMAFHTMEFDGWVGGFCFARDTEAQQFASAVPASCPKGTGGPPPAPARPGPPDPAPPAPPGRPASPAAIATRPIAPPAAEPPPEEDNKRRGWFGKKKKEKKETERPMEIGAPTNFKHITHIGWDESNGFDVRNLPEEWKSLFKAAGVKKKDLAHKDTAKLIMQVRVGVAVLPVVQETAELIVPSLGEACARLAPRLTLSSSPHSHPRPTLPLAPLSCPTLTLAPRRLWPRI